MTLLDFLNYAAGPGINAIVGFLLSFAVEWVPGFDSLGAKWKRGLTMALSFLVPVTATFLLWLINGFPSGPALGEGIWGAFLSGFLAFFTSQAAHLRKLKSG